MRRLVLMLAIIVGLLFFAIVFQAEANQKSVGDIVIKQLPLLIDANQVRLRLHSTADNFGSIRDQYYGLVYIRKAVTGIQTLPAPPRPDDIIIPIPSTGRILTTWAKVKFR